MEWKSICFKNVLEPSLFCNFLNYPHLSSSSAWWQQKTMVITNPAVVVDTMIQQPDPLSLVKDLLFPSCWKTAADSVQLSALFRTALADDSHLAWGCTYHLPGQSRSNAWYCMQEYKGLAGSLPQLWRPSLSLNHCPTFPSAQSCFLQFLSFPSTGGNPQKTSY